MKKIAFVLGMVVALTSCSVIESTKEAVDETSQDEPEVVEVEKPFEERTVEATYVSITAVNGLNVRQEGDIESDILARVDYESKFQVIDSSQDSWKRKWYLIEYEPGKEGWIASWFAAKTTVTILVKEEETLITEIAVKPTPVYLENPFEPEEADIGDAFNGLELVRKEEIESVSSLVFEGEVTLSGTYDHVEVKTGFGRQIQFKPDEPSAVLLPRINEPVDTLVFEFSNYEKAVDLFGEVGKSGQATVVIDQYVIAYGSDDAINQGRLVNQVN